MFKKINIRNNIESIDDVVGVSNSGSSDFVNNKNNNPLKPEKKKKSLFKEIIGWFLAISFVLVIRSFIFEPFVIPSGSMLPNILIGDFVVVSKSSYGFSRYSLPFDLDLLPKERVLFDEPKRGDIAVFSYPSDTSIDYIKRVIGLPSDKVQVKNGILHINDEAVKRKKIEDFDLEQEGFGFSLPVTQYVETLPNGVSYRIIETNGNNGPADNTEVFYIPEGHYFMMGDNRDQSADSRFPDVGFVPKENLMGKAKFVALSMKSRFWEVWKWPTEIRWNRFFKSLYS